MHLTTLRNQLSSLFLIISLLSACKDDDGPAPPQPEPEIPKLINKIAFLSNRTGTFEIFTMHADGSQPARLIEGQAAHLDISKDGSKLAFIRNGQLFVADAEGNNQRQLTLTGSSNSPKWSPDGSRIAIYSFIGGGNAKLQIIAADGSNVVEVNNPTDMGYSNPKWSPDGSKLCFEVVSESSILHSGEIYLVKADGTGLQNITNNNTSDSDYNWSPDGAKIVFVGMRDGNSEIYSMNADGTGVRRLTYNTASDFGPVFSPDGSKIAFVSNRDGSLEIFLMNTDGTGVQQLTHAEPSQAHHDKPVWTPNGSSLLFQRTNVTPAGAVVNTDIYLIRQDGSGLTNLTSHPGYNINPVVGPAE